MRHLARGLFSTAAFLVALFLVSAPAHATSIASPFKVEIAIDAASLNAPLYATHGGFYVDTKITNVSDRNQEIIVWTQCGWSWLSDASDRVRPGIEALKNVPSRIVLKPEQEYSRKLEMWSVKKAGPVTFRLGFVPKVKVPGSTQNIIDRRWGRISWSNPVTLRR